MKLRLSSLLLVLAVGAQAPAAHAQADASSRALAVQLFDEAEALFSKGQTADACPKYAESYRLDAQLGVLIYLAECYEKNGQVASAWGSYREAEEVARKRSDPRGDHARERAGALEAQLSYLVISVPEASRVPGLELTRDEAALAPVLWGKRAASDPGTHRVRASAPGYEPWQGEVVVSPKGSATLEVPKLVASPSASTASTTVNAPASPDGASAMTSRRITALAVGGLGVVAIGVGGFFGLSAQSSNSDSKALCGAQNFCTPQGKELRDSAQSKATIATVAVSVGAAALIAGGVLWFTAPKAGDKVAKTGRDPQKSKRWAIAPSSRSWGLEVTGAF